MKRFVICCIALILSQVGYVSAEDALSEQTREALKKTTAYLRSISTHGGYVGIYSLDLKQRYGEALYESAKPTEIWVQPPGTPSMGEAFLRAYRITEDGEYLAAGRDAARALAWGQRQSGGWDHLVDVGDLQPDSKRPTRKSGRCTFDDNITQGALSFLMSMDEVMDEAWLSEAVQLGLDHMLRSQFENGAWPQWYPLIGGYHDYYTFNDRAINDCIRVMVHAHEMYGKEEYLRSAEDGGDFIILSQIASPQSGWAQQYAHDMKPARARAYEPPGVCSAVTSRNIRTLVDLYLYTKEEKYLAPILAAIDWLERSKIGENRWARFYELGTNKPIYGDRDGKVYYNYEEISEERKSGYGWQGGFGVTSAIRYYNEVKNLGVDQYLAERSKPLTAAQRKQMALYLASKVKHLIATLDDQGRWVEDNMIYSRIFINNFNVLCDYLSMVTTDVPTIVTETEDVGTPMAYTLGQNYPNPFNGETTLAYALPEERPVRIAVFDLLGRKVRVLFNQRRPGGSYSVTWDGRDEIGRDAASGIYLCLMQAKRFRQTQKLILMR